MAELNLLDLMPKERDTVRFPNGKVVESVHMEEMEPGQYAKFLQMESRITKLQGLLEGAEMGDPEEAVKLLDDMHGILGDAIKAIMVDLDDETLESAPFFIRTKIIEWWSMENKPAPKVLGQESQS